MMKRISSPEAPEPAGPYSPGIVSGGFLFVAGQGPFDADGKRSGETFAEQTRRTFENIDAIARAAGTSLANAVRIGVYLNDMADWPELNELTREILTEPYPARTSLQADLKGFAIEVDAVIEMSQE